MYDYVVIYCDAHDRHAKNVRNSVRSGSGKSIEEGNFQKSQKMF